MTDPIQLFDQDEQDLSRRRILRLSPAFP